MSPGEETVTQLQKQRMCRRVGEEKEAGKHVLMSPGEQQLRQRRKCRGRGQQAPRARRWRTMLFRAVADASLDDQSQLKHTAAFLTALHRPPCT